MPRQSVRVDKKEQNDSAIGILLSIRKATWREVFPQKVYVNASRRCSEGCDEEESSLVKRLDYSCCSWTIAGGKCPQARKRSQFTGKFMCKSREETLGGLCGSHQGTQQCKKLWGLSPKYCSEPWTMDAENQKYIFCHHQERESDAGISN